MKLTLLVGDSIFSYCLVYPIIKSFRQQIDCILLSQHIRSSPRRILTIFKKSSFHYFFYRSVIHAYSIFTKKTVESLAKKSGIKTISIFNCQEIKKVIADAELGIAINFDLILNTKCLQKFPKGVLNLHASKLPSDRGISPAYWAFARGDRENWSTIYQMDDGLDSGPIYKQWSMPIQRDDTAFTMYKRLCRDGGNQLVQLIKEIELGIALPPRPQPSIENATSHSWPNRSQYALMVRNRRCYLRTRDLLRP